jgi:hypothetical protein
MTPRQLSDLFTYALDLPSGMGIPPSVLMLVLEALTWRQRKSAVAWSERELRVAQALPQKRAHGSLPKLPRQLEILARKYGAQHFMPPRKLRQSYRLEEQARKASA